MRSSGRFSARSLSIRAAWKHTISMERGCCTVARTLPLSLRSSMPSSSTPRARLRSCHWDWSEWSRAAMPRPVAGWTARSPWIRRSPSDTHIAACWPCNWVTSRRLAPMARWRFGSERGTGCPGWRCSRWWTRVAGTRSRLARAYRSFCKPSSTRCTLPPGMRATSGRRCSPPPGKIDWSSSWNGSSRAARRCGLICACPSTIPSVRTLASSSWSRSLDRSGRRDETRHMAPLVAGCRGIGDQAPSSMPRRLATGMRLWGEQYDRAQADLLELQEGIARAVTGVIAGRLLPVERATLAARPTRSPEAYDYFVKGNYYLAQRTARSTKQAVDQYRAALRLDPGFTRALARIAYAHAQTLYWGSFPEDVPADSVLARGLAAADGALRQDSTSSDAWMARAFLLSYRYPRAPVMAREAIERAVALDPRNAEAHHQYGTVLTNHGEYAAAVGQYQQALTIDPQRGTTLTGLGMVSLRRREYAAARAWLDSSLAVDPGFYPGYVRRAEARLLLGDTAAARSDAETATRLSAGDPLLGEAVLALVEARAGDTLSARARVGRLLREVALLEQRVRGGAVLAMALIALGDHQAALDLLERLRPRGTWLWDQLQYLEF